MERVASKTKTSNALAESMVLATLDAILDEVRASGAVLLSGFGKFAYQTLPERRAAHPVTGQIRRVPAIRKLAFRAAADNRVRL